MKNMPEKLDIILITSEPLIGETLNTLLREYHLTISGIHCIADWRWADEITLSADQLADALAMLDNGRIVLIELCDDCNSDPRLYGFCAYRCAGDYLYDFFLDMELCPFPQTRARTENEWIAHCLPHIHAALARDIPCWRAVAIGAESNLDYTGDIDAAMCQPNSNIAYWIRNEERGVN